MSFCLDLPASFVYRSEQMKIACQSCVFDVPVGEIHRFEGHQSDDQSKYSPHCMGFSGFSVSSMCQLYMVGYRGEVGLCRSLCQESRFTYCSGKCVTRSNLFGETHTGTSDVCLEGRSKHREHSRSNRLWGSRSKRQKGYAALQVAVQSGSMLHFEVPQGGVRSFRISTHVC